MRRRLRLQHDWLLQLQRRLTRLRFAKHYPQTRCLEWQTLRRHKSLSTPLRLRCVPGRIYHEIRTHPLAVQIGIQELFRQRKSRRSTREMTTACYSQTASRVADGWRPGRSTRAGCGRGSVGVATAATLSLRSTIELK